MMSDRQTRNNISCGCGRVISGCVFSGGEGCEDADFYLTHKSHTSNGFIGSNLVRFTIQRFIGKEFN